MDSRIRSESGPSTISIAQLCTAIDAGVLRPAIDGGDYLFKGATLIQVLHIVEAPGPGAAVGTWRGASGRPGRDKHLRRFIHPA